MPNYLLEHSKIKLPRAHDARVHITEEDKKQIHLLYHEAKLPVREIARRFEGIASRRSIQFILFPERLAKAKPTKEQRNSYYVREKHTLAMAKHRAKKKLYLVSIGASESFANAKKHNLPFDPSQFQQ